MAIQKTEKIWHNGKLINWDDARLHVMSHVVNYGSSVFEGVRCYSLPAGPAIFRANEHIQRLLVKSPPGLGKTREAIGCAVTYQAEQEEKGPRDLLVEIVDGDDQELAAVRQPEEKVVVARLLEETAKTPGFSRGFVVRCETLRARGCALFGALSAFRLPADKRWLDDFGNRRGRPVHTTEGWYSGRCGMLQWSTLFSAWHRTH